MSPPIFNPDGPEVSEIVLPNGSTASEVIDPDGNVVFEAGPDIPDSVASYQEDGTTSTDTATDDRGIAFEIDADYGEIGFRLDPNVNSVSQADLIEIENTSTNTDLNNQVKSVDISPISAGDSFTFAYNYDADIRYAMSVGNGGATFTRAFTDTSNVGVPITSENIDIVGGYDSNETSNFYYNINACGDPNDL
jgi:hypothetical protein